MAIATEETARCTPAEWAELYELALNGMLFEIQDWIREGRPTLRPLKQWRSLLRLAVERRFHSMAKLVWESGFQDSEEVVVALRIASLKPWDTTIFRYLLEAGCPVDTLSVFALCKSNDPALIRIGIARGVCITGDHGWRKAFLKTGGKPLINFFLQEKHQVPGLMREGVRALCEAIAQDKIRRACLLMWAGVDPFIPCPLMDCDWKEPEETWTYFPAMYLIFSRKWEDMLRSLNLAPSPPQWLKLVQTLTHNPKLHEALVALRSDGDEILRGEQKAMEELLLTFLKRSCEDGQFYHEPHSVGVCRWLINLGATLDFRCVKTVRQVADSILRFEKEYSEGWQYTRKRHEWFFKVLEFAWDTGLPWARDFIRGLSEYDLVAPLMRRDSRLLAIANGLSRSWHYNPSGRLKPRKVDVLHEAPYGYRGPKITREELHEAVWRQPALKVAKQYSVSSSYLKRVCRCLQVPTPPPGYWPRPVAARKYLYKPLPPFKGEGVQYWCR